MIEQKRGEIVLMSSLAGFEGSGFLSTYAAARAFSRLLSESSWYEWKSKGVDLIACCAVAKVTPNYIQIRAKPDSWRPGHEYQEVDAFLRRIGKTPSFISGNGNRIISFMMQHVFLRKMSISLMGNTTRRMYEINY